jgi:hypothetical protein
MPGPNRRKEKESSAPRSTRGAPARGPRTGEGSGSALARLHEQEKMRGNLAALLEDVADAPRDKHGDEPTPA